MVVVQQNLINASLLLSPPIRGAGEQSIGLTLPIEIVRKLGWRERQKVVVKRIKGGIQIRDWKK